MKFTTAFCEPSGMVKMFVCVNGAVVYAVDSEMLLQSGPDSMEMY